MQTHKATGCNKHSNSLIFKLCPIKPTLNPLNHTSLSSLSLSINLFDDFSKFIANLLDSSSKRTKLRLVKSQNLSRIAKCCSKGLVEHVIKGMHMLTAYIKTLILSSPIQLYQIKFEKQLFILKIVRTQVLF